MQSKNKWKTQVKNKLNVLLSVSQSDQSTSTSPDDAEKKKVNASAYRNFLNRDGPRALGSKEIPQVTHTSLSSSIEQNIHTAFVLFLITDCVCVFQGAENCLEGCVFVLTGVLESMERDDAKALIERYGGKVTGNISKKTTYMVQGRDSGVSKFEKVTNLIQTNKFRPGEACPEENVCDCWMAWFLAVV